MRDYPKTFTSLLDDLLRAALVAYGISNELTFLQMYLANRKQYTEIVFSYSTWYDMIKDLHGPVTTPLLFNIFMSYVFFFIEKIKICKFADNHPIVVTKYPI